jgi:hypothetical protein
MENLLPKHVDHLMPYTDKQRTSLLRIHGRHVAHTDHPLFSGMGFISWVVQDCVLLHFDDCALCNVPHMSIGIERDGYAHT